VSESLEKEEIYVTAGRATGGTISGGDVGGTESKPKHHVIREAKKAAPREPSRPTPTPSVPPPPPANDTRVAPGDAKMKNLPTSVVHGNQTIIIEGWADANRTDGARRATDRANIVKNQLIDQGVAPARIKVVTKVEPGAGERVRLVAQAPSAPDPS